MYERDDDQLLPRRHFLRRLANMALMAILVIAASLLIGVMGYHYVVGLAWVDAFLNASMILSGMGPVDAIQGRAAKIFAGCYALFSGVIFLSTAAILLAPLVHRILHRFHLKPENDAPKNSR